MDKAIYQVLSYFYFFSYPPCEDEIYTFLPIKCTRQDLHKSLDRLIITGKVEATMINAVLHYNAISSKKSYAVFLRQKERGLKIQDKVFQIFNVCRYIPVIKYMGISGSLSMCTISNKSDIDIFVITKKNAIWQTRMILLMYKKILSIFMSDFGKKLCFNLFYSEDGLKIQSNKQNEYVGHEVLQLKEILNKNNMCDKFLAQNKWIAKFFPNVSINVKNEKKANTPSRQSFIGSMLERLCMKIQKMYLVKTGYRFEDRGSQLTLFQRDFEKKLRWRMGGYLR